MVQSECWVRTSFSFCWKNRWITYCSETLWGSFRDISYICIEYVVRDVHITWNVWVCECVRLIPIQQISAQYQTNCPRRLQSSYQKEKEKERVCERRGRGGGVRRVGLFEQVWLVCNWLWIVIALNCTAFFQPACNEQDELYENWASRVCLQGNSVWIVYFK